MVVQRKVLFMVLILLLSGLLTNVALAAPAHQVSTCDDLPDHAALHEALLAARQDDNGGFGLDMWGTIVDRDGNVCAVAFTGADRGAQFPGSRVVSAAKANTANALSLPFLALSSANLYSGAQPGQSTFSIEAGSPVDTQMAYGGDAAQFGQPDDPMVGHRIGGIVVFAGGLALYNSDGVIVGGLGVSGDSSCADHNIAWKTRDALDLDYVPGGVSPTGDDNIVYDITNGVSASGFGHPVCSEAAQEIAEALPETHPTGTME